MDGSDSLKDAGNWVVEDDEFSSLLTYFDLPMESLEGDCLNVGDWNPVLDNMRPIDSEVMNSGLSGNALNAPPSAPLPGEMKFELKPHTNVPEQAPALQDVFQAPTLAATDSLQSGVRATKSGFISDSTHSGVSLAPTLVTLSRLYQAPSLVSEGIQSRTQSASPVSVSNGINSGVPKAPNAASICDGSHHGVSQAPQPEIDGEQSGVQAISVVSVSESVKPDVTGAPSPKSVVSDGLHSGIFQTNSPVSVLESGRSCSGEKTIPTSSETVTAMRTRSKRIRNPTYKPWFEISEPIKRRPKKKKRLSQLSGGTKDDFSGTQLPGSPIMDDEGEEEEEESSLRRSSTKKCTHCEMTKTPQWREGPLGPKTLCNACGVRYRSGRLLPEYRPAASPTFVPSLHSNSHRKVIEMRSREVTNFKKEIALPSSPEFVPRSSYLFDD